MPSPLLLTLACVAFIHPQLQGWQGQPGARPVLAGWRDELNDPKAWSPLKIENKPTVTVPEYGALRLTLGHVPADWPYQYQWSGITRQAQVDVARYPYLTAYVSELMGGYAHRCAGCGRQGSEDDPVQHVTGGRDVVCESEGFT